MRRIFFSLIAIFLLSGVASAGAQDLPMFSGIGEFSGINDLVPDQRPEDPPLEPLQVVITWKAESSAPQTFQGRVLPTPGGPVSFVISGIRNGQSVDLAPYMMVWRVNNKVAQRGTGLVRLSQTIKEFAGASLDIAVTVEETTSTRRRSIGRGIISIPIGEPELVINVPYPDRTVPVDNAVLQVIPFFFNAAVARSLSYGWHINYVQIPAEQSLGTIISAGFEGPARSIPVFVTARSIDPGFSNKRTITYISAR